MKRGARTSLIVLVGLSLLLVMFLVWFDWNRLQGIVVQAVNEHTGRNLEIDGDIDVRLSMTPIITLDQITLSNADWASTEQMLKIERLRLSIKLWELLKGRVVLPTLEFYGPVVELEKDSKGNVNWQFDEKPKTESERRAGFPVIGRLHIERGKVRYLDSMRELEFSGKIATVAGKGDVHDSVELTAGGKLKKQPFSLQMVAGSLIDLTDEKHLYPVQLKLKVADTKLAVKGNMDRPLRLRGVDLTINVEGPDLSQLYLLTGTVLPGTPPYKISGKLNHRENIWHVESLDGHIGDSDIAGSFEVDNSRERMFIRADLTSEQLDFDDLGPLIGAPPSAKPGETISAEQRENAAKLKRSGKVIPDQSFNLSRLRDADAEFKYSARHVLAPDIPLGSLRFAVHLQDAIMIIDPLQFELAGGAVEGKITVDATEQEIHWNYDLALKKLGIGRLVKAGTDENIANGSLNGTIKMRSHGNSMHEAAANGNGTIKLSVAGGRLSNLLIELIGLDVAESLGLVLTDTVESIPFRCAIGDLSLSEGIVTSQVLVVDTEDTRIDAELHADLDNENYKLTLLPKPKDSSLLSARAPLYLHGSFRELKIRPDFGSLGLRAGAAAALGVIATPLAALLAFIEPGTGDDADCEKLDSQP